MVGGRLYTLDSFSIFQRKVREYLVKKVLLLDYELDILWIGSGYLLLEESLEPLQLNIHSVFHECVLRKILPQVVGLASVSPING